MINHAAKRPKLLINTQADGAGSMAFQAHLRHCMEAVRKPMGRTDIRVTIIVRAPEDSPAHAVVSTNDDMNMALAALLHFPYHSRIDPADSSAR